MHIISPNKSDDNSPKIAYNSGNSSAELHLLWKGIKHFEAGPNGPYQCKWDFKLNTWGYGTPCLPKGTELTPELAELEMKRHARIKMNRVLNGYWIDSKYLKDIDPDSRTHIKITKLGIAKPGYRFVRGIQHLKDHPLKLMALTDLTYNTGEKWMLSGLGVAVRNKNWKTAHVKFRQYVHAGGKPLDGLIKRREYWSPVFTGKRPPTLKGYGGAGTTVKAGKGGKYLNE